MNLFIKWWRIILHNERGGGSSGGFQAAPTTPAPDPGESAESLYQARLKYDPQIAALEQQLAEQYQPQQAQLAAELYGQYAPQIAGLQEQLRQQYAPEQTALTQAFAQQAQQRLAYFQHFQCYENQNVL